MNCVVILMLSYIPIYIFKKISCSSSSPLDYITRASLVSLVIFMYTTHTHTHILYTRTHTHVRVRARARVCVCVVVVVVVVASEHHG